MTWKDPKMKKDNMYAPRLNDYEDEKWRALCTLKNMPPNTLARVAMLAYLRHNESVVDDDMVDSGNQCA